MRHTPLTDSEGNRTALLANPGNPRLPWSDEQAEAFKRSLAEFGDLSGVTENKRTGRLVGGHKRVEQFQLDAEAKVAIAETLKEPDATGTLAFGYVVTMGTRFSYRLVDWPEDKEAAANLAANQWGAEFDWQGVSQMLAQAGGFDLTLTGFEQHTLDNLRQATWTPPAVADKPESEGGGKIDPIHLDKEARAALDAAKVKLGEADDVKAIAAVCQFYSQGE